MLPNRFIYNKRTLHEFHGPRVASLGEVHGSPTVCAVRRFSLKSLPHDLERPLWPPLLHCIHIMASVAKKTAIPATPCLVAWEECTLQRRQCHPVISVILKVDEQTGSQETKPQ